MTPNETIFFENISITQINRRHLSKPFKISLKLHLFPKISFRIESECLPKDLINLQHGSFQITTSEGFETKVHLRYNLNDFIRSGDRFKGYLLPAVLPCTVLDSDVEVRRVSFGILNFRKFYGKHDKWIDENGHSRRLGVSEICVGDFEMQIAECKNFSENKKFLSRNDGYTVTHVGFIERIDRTTFAAKDIDNLLKATRAFVSFARGSACGLTLVKATTINGEDKFLEWGATHTEPWICGSETWLLTTEGGDILSQLFPTFYEFCGDLNWRDTMFSVVDWYLNSNDSPFHVGIILAQAALEALSYKELGRKVRPVDNQIRKALSSIGVSEKIPASCRELNRWTSSIERSSARPPGDGPEAITQIRNDLVHAGKRFGHIPAEVQMDALRLSQWYIEMILLNKLGHVGQYRNRVSEFGRGSTEYVPWKI